MATIQLGHGERHYEATVGIVDPPRLERWEEPWEVTLRLSPKDGGDPSYFPIAIDLTRVEAMHVIAKICLALALQPPKG